MAALVTLVVPAALGWSQSLESVLPGFWVFRVIAEVDGGDPDSTPRAVGYESTMEFRAGGVGAEHVADVTIEFRWKVLDDSTLVLTMRGVDAELWITRQDASLLYAVSRDPDDPARLVFTSYTRYPVER